MSKRRDATNPAATVRAGGADPHGKLVDNLVHVFVDDQNLFYGIVNDERGRSFRMDFGQLLVTAAMDAKRKGRGVASAYIAGVIPDDDSFWRVAKNQGFEVRRGFLGANQRSKQDDAHLIVDITRTLYKKKGPSTIVLVAGDADYGPPLEAAIQEGWRTEVAFIRRGISTALTRWVHEFRTISATDIEYNPDWRG